MREEEVKPDKPIVRRYLGDADYPTGLRELVSEAESNGAPQAVVAHIRNAATERFESPEEVLQAVRGR